MGTRTLAVAAIEKDFARDGDIAGVDAFRVRQKLSPHPRTAAVRGDQHVAFGAAAVGEMRHHTARRQFFVAHERLAERRERTLHGLWKGNVLRRRRGGRRDGDAHPAGIDWHDAHWLGAAVLVVLLSIADALLTLTLMKHGAREVNPLMAPLVVGSGRGFALWKLTLG